MPLSTLQIAGYFARNPDNAVVRDMLVDALSPVERKLYYLIAKTGPTTTAELRKAIRSTIPSTGNMLLHMFNYGLLAREIKTDEQGLYYIWRIRNA